VVAISQSINVRDGIVEESERSEGDNVGLRAFVGRRQAVVSTNDLTGEGAQTLAERAVAMARAAPEDRFAGLAEPELLARAIPDLDLLDAALPAVDALEELARTAEGAALAVAGVTKSSGASASAGIGGMVLITSGGFRGAYLGSSYGVSMQAIAGEGTAMETDYDYTSARHAADLEAAAKIGRSAGLRFVYAGNLPGNTGDLENTMCPSCGRPVVERLGFRVLRNRISSEGACPHCGVRIPGVWGELPRRPGEAGGLVHIRCG